MAEKQAPDNGNQLGFIHNLSPVKCSQKTKAQWYDFDLQTSPKKVRRVVGFNIGNHSTLQQHEQSKSAVLLINTKESNSKDIIFNQQSDVRAAPAFDIDFDYDGNVAPSEVKTAHQPAKTITLDQLQTLKFNQAVDVTGTISLGSQKPKEITLKPSNTPMLVKEDCVIEDGTGTAAIHLWDNLIDKVKNASTYEFCNLKVKMFQGNTHLSTTSMTTIKQTDQKLKDLRGPELLENPEKEGKVTNFKFVNKLSVFIPCQACKRKITETCNEKYIKCKNCGVRQRQDDCKREASVQLKMKLDEKEVWLTAFTEVIESLLAVSTDVSLLSTSDSIEEKLLDLKNIHFKYNSTKNVIIEVISVSD